MARVRQRASSQYGFFPAPGTNYSSGVEPEIARRLNRLGKALKLHLIGVSGFRSPAHSVAVGGFANDPHTQGRASDTPGIESVPEGVLRRFGLTRPFPGASEADHIQLLGAGGGSSTIHRSGPTFTLAELWTQAGGSRNLAPIMAAIAMAESGGRTDNVGGPNSDGTYDYGLWQINSSHTQFDRNRLLTDPVYNARAAVSIERSQGLGAWTTYKNGAFRQYLGSGRTVTPQQGIVRPGGPETGPSGAETEFAAYTQDAGWYFNPLVPVPLPFKVPGPQLNIPIPNPLDIFKGAAAAVKDTGTFLQWIAWLFHPKNVLRAVEFVTGLTILGFGLHTLLAVYKDAPQTGAAPRAAQRVRTAAGEAVSMTPVGRAARVTRARKAGKRAARRGIRETEAKAAARKGRAQETKRQAKASQKRGKRAARFSKEDVPF